MTYCVAMSLDAGMIFASDSRTNAGVDQIARFSKMRVFSREGDRVVVALSSGNLSLTQNALSVPSWKQWVNYRRRQSHLRNKYVCHLSSIAITKLHQTMCFPA